MKEILRLGIVLGLAAPASLMAQNGAAPKRMAYPVAKKTDQTDDYHGTRVADPYRWLENSDSAETAEWVEAENRVTAEYLSAIPSRSRFKDRLTTLYDYERYARFEKAGGHYLFLRNDGLQNQNVLYAEEAIRGKERVLLDPNTLRADGTAALSEHVASKDGRLLAYGLADAGSDWCEWHVRDIASGKDLPDVIRWNKFNPVAWAADQRGFYYLRFPEPKAGEALRDANRNSKLYLHRLGEPQSADTLIYERPDQPQWMFTPGVTDDGRYLVILTETGDFGRNLVAYQDLHANPPKTVELIHDLRAAYGPLGNQGSVFYFQTTDRAAKGRIIAIDLTKPARENWREVVPEQKEPIASAQMVNGHLVVSYLKDAANQLKVISLDGRDTREVPLPGMGQVTFFPSHQDDTEMFFGFNEHTTPMAMYRLDLRTAAASVVRQSKLSFNPAQFETRQIFYASKDGTKIPMSLVYRKGLKLDGHNPTLLYGYGGFNVSVLPSFNPWTIEWMELGGVWAVANLRGGAEYGDDWHEAGKREKKQNVFDDFIAAAEWLIANRYTSTPRLAIYGGSNGGLLIGAVLNQRPELFGAAMAAVGVMDMLRFQKFTIGAAWVDEYGSSDNAKDFPLLFGYSPLHNIRKGTKYPPVLITTSDHDDRVVPGHSFKYAATMQAAQEGPAPILIRIETRAGHGAGKPTTKTIDEYADRLAFLTRELGME
ncbi:MAG TPA: prolyl oligopeptidase family serine peptidase [Bryobacteraceae bacterium]